MSQQQVKLAEASKVEEAGDGVLFKVEDGHLIIDVDLSRNATVSSTGKSMLIAQTGGFQTIHKASDGRLIKLSAMVSYPNK